MKNPHQTFFLVQTLLVVGRLVSCKLIWLGLLFKLLLCTVFRNHRSMLHSNCYCCMLFYWNLTEKFCQITILFPWQNKMHPSISWYIVKLFSDVLNILKRILKWTDCWRLNNLETVFQLLLLFWIFGYTSFRIKSQNEMDLKIQRNVEQASK